MRAALVLLVKIRVLAKMRLNVLGLGLSVNLLMNEF